MAPHGATATTPCMLSIYHGHGTAAGSKVVHTLVHVAVDLYSSAVGKSMHAQGCATSIVGISADGLFVQDGRQSD